MAGDQHKPRTGTSATLAMHRLKMPENGEINVNILSTATHANDVLCIWHDVVHTSCAGNHTVIPRHMYTTHTAV